MSISAHAGFAVKQHQLQTQLGGFWAEDEWDLSKCPVGVTAPGRFRTIRFGCTSNVLNVELKYACKVKFERGEWSPRCLSRPTHIHRIVAWLNSLDAPIESLQQQPAAVWEASLRAFLVATGHWYERLNKRLDAAQEIRQYLLPDLCFSTFRQMYHVIGEAYDDRAEYAKDVWDVRKLGIAYMETASSYKLNFTGLAQPWLRDAVKQWIKYNLALHSHANACAKIGALTTFSTFLSQTFPSIQATDLDRALILGYLSYLASSRLFINTRRRHLHELRLFLDLCQREGWASIPEKALIYDEDFPPPERYQPRYIPETVLAQLNQHLGALPVPVMRMVLILQECGMRISELCLLPFDCLRQDADGDWWLQYYQSKLKKDHTIPVFPEVVTIIHEQQQTVRATWGAGTPFLFPDRKGRPIKRYVFNEALNRLAYTKEICGPDGTLFRFQAHQFRHTVGTRMLNKGYPHHIIQRYLGHESPDMTSRYAHLHDMTMKQAMEQFRGGEVDITGRMVTPEGNQHVNSNDARLLKKHIQEQALPNGRCALPTGAQACPHANACLTCVHFRTDAGFLPIHQAQREETARIVEAARAHGWIRMLEMNERIAENLDRIILALELPNR